MLYLYNLQQLNVSWLLNDDLWFDINGCLNYNGHREMMPEKKNVVNKCIQRPINILFHFSSVFLTHYMKIFAPLYCDAIWKYLYRFAFYVQWNPVWFMNEIIYLLNVIIALRTMKTLRFLMRFCEVHSKEQQKLRRFQNLSLSK